MVELNAFQEWLDRYIAAWKTNDAAAAGDLFTEDAEYRYYPWEEPVRGRAAIQETWDQDDPPGSFEAEYRAEVVSGDAGVGTGISRYFPSEKRPQGAEYHNCFLLRFADDGRVREYREWYMERPMPE